MSAAAPTNAAELARRFAAALVRPPAPASRVRRVQALYASFAGVWTFTGWTRDDRGARPVRGTLICAFSSDGAWLRAHYRERATSDNPRPCASTDHWGVDEDDAPVRFGFGAAASGFFGASDGWRGGSLTWDGRWYGAGRTAAARDVLRVEASGRLAIAGYVHVEGAEAQVAGLTLVRIPA